MIRLQRAELWQDYNEPVGRWTGPGVLGGGGWAHSAPACGRGSGCESYVQNEALIQRKRRKQINHK